MALAAGTGTKGYVVNTGLDPSAFTEVSAWCQENLGPHGTSWCTALRLDGDPDDALKSPYRISILTGSLEHHLLVLLRWA